MTQENIKLQKGAFPLEESLQLVIDELNKAELIYIFPHIVADADTLGSSAALCKALRKMGKESHVLIEDGLPKNIAFLDKGYTIRVDCNTIMPPPDLSIALDCSNVDRFPERENLFLSAKQTACIDHHLTQSEFANVRHIDPSAAATAELIYKVLKNLDVEIDKEMAEAIYTGIVMDTGNFQYSNTTKETHNIVAELFDLGIDHNSISLTLFQNDRLQKLVLHTLIMKEMQVFCEGKAAIAWVTLDMFKQADADLTESEGINNALRNIQGVEVAVFLREKYPEEIKVGMRSKRYIDVSKICKGFGGGGHKHSAGCTILKPLAETADIVMDAVKKAIEEYGI